MLSKDIDDECTLLLQDIVRFQDRAYEKDPIKARARRRYVLGLREVYKHVKLRAIKLVVVSTNLEKCNAKGGLDDVLAHILQQCGDQAVPCIFALNRKALGRACAKQVPVSIVGIFNYDGTEAHYHKLMSLSAEARRQYQQLVERSERGARPAPSPPPTTPAAVGVPGVPGVAQGHSRTPSACSAISITSSLISEPISENYALPADCAAAAAESSFRRFIPTMSSLVKPQPPRVGHVKPFSSKPAPTLTQSHPSEPTPLQTPAAAVTLTFKPVATAGSSTNKERVQCWLSAAQQVEAVEKAPEE